MLYQAELLSDTSCDGRPRLGRRPYNDAPRPPQPGKNPRADGHLAGLRAGRAGLYGAALLGRRQVVRHRILIPAFGGSIPPAPASFSLAIGEEGSPAARFCSRRSSLSQVHRTCSRASPAAPHPSRASLTRF